MLCGWLEFEKPLLLCVAMIMMLVVEPKKLLLLCKVFKCNDYHVSSWNLNIANVVLSLLKQIDCVLLCLFRNRWQMSWVHLWFSLTSFVSLLWSVIVLTHGNMESILYGKKKKCCGRWCDFNRSWARTNQKCMCNSAFHTMCSVGTLTLSLLFMVYICSS